MKLASVVAAMVLASGGWATAAAQSSYVSPHPQLVKPVEGQPGRVRVAGGYTGDFMIAMQQFLIPHGWVVTCCRYFYPKLGPGVEVEVADTLEGARELVRRAGGELVAVGERVLLMTDLRNEACQPLGVFFTAKRVAEMGGAMAAELSEEELAWLLLATAPPIRSTIVNTYSWPTREGQGREYYVYELSMTPEAYSRTPDASLRKVSVERRDGTLELKEMWPSDGRTTYFPYVTLPGPVTTLELDFDDDGVIDVVAFSGLEGNEVGTTPLVIVSGRTGERLGEIEGDELVVTRSATGVKVRTLGTRQDKDYVRVDDRTYWVNTRIQRLYVFEEGDLSLAWEREESGYCSIGGPLENRPAPRDYRIPDIGRPRAADKPLLRPKREKEDLASLAPGEQLLAHVMVADARVLRCFDRGPWHGIPALGRIGEQILWPGRNAPELANARILFEYHPPKLEEHRQP